MNVLKNRWTTIGGAAFGLVLLVEVVLLGIVRVKLAGARKNLKNNQQALMQLHDRRPYPSEENLKEVQQNLDRLEYAVGEFAAVMVRDPFPLEAVDAADFSARAQDVIERFRKQAETAGVELPKSLEVGFAAYASGGTVPEPQHVPRLSRQLYSVERVADLLVQGGVGKISGLSRDMFEAEPTAPEGVPRRRARRIQPVSDDRKAEDRAASIVHEDNLYYVERVSVEFTADEDAVWRVLELFATSGHFMVVSEFSHSTQSGILAYDPEAIRRGGNEDDATLRYLSEGILVGKKALSRAERIVAGKDDIQVRLAVDVYNFEPEAGR